MHTVIQCVSCDGYGWVEDDLSGETADCDWCDGTGYVYRDEHGIDHPIPAADYAHIAEVLENLEKKRLRNMGYTGDAKHPDDQDIRK
ncbi:MAG: hypothetical protein OHK0046_22430 [Anaerolineae bacterium]